MSAINKSLNPLVHAVKKLQYQHEIDYDIAEAILSKNRTIQQSLRNVGEKMGLTFNLTMHCARHTFAILALQSNVPVYQVSRLMGHTTINTVQLTYARFIPIDESEKALGKIGFGGFISLS